MISKTRKKQGALMTVATIGANRRTAMAMGLLAALLAGSALGWTERVLGYGGLNALARSNEQYLDDAFDRSLRLFAVLSAVKVGLAVIEGSEVGAGFGVEVGDFVQAAYDHVDTAWRVVLAAGVMLKTLKYVLRAADYLDHWALIAALACGLFAMALPLLWPSRTRLRRTARDGSLLFTAFAVALFLLLPVTVAGGQWLSGRITAPALDQAESGLLQIQKDLERVSEIVYDPNKSAIANLLDSPGAKVEQLVDFVLEKTANLAAYLFTVIAVYVFDCALFPAAMLIFWVWLTRWTARYFLRVKRDRDFKDDLRAILRQTVGLGKK